MNQVSLSIGYFSPEHELGKNVQGVCEKICELCGPASLAFPFVHVPVRENGATLLSYGVIYGHVPIHVDRPNAKEACSTIFTFVLAANNRPVLLYAPAGQQEAQCVFVPSEAKAPRMGLGAVELWPGKALYFDVARSFHGISGFPTGDVQPDLPAAVLVQVPWPRADDIGGAIHRMRTVMARDERFNGLIQTGDENEIRGDPDRPR